MRWKKAGAFLMGILLVLSCTACDIGAPKIQEISLTAENFEEYFIVERTVENYRVEEEESTRVLGVYFPGSYTAYADICLQVRPRSSFEVSNVTATALVYVFDKSDWNIPEKTVSLQIGAAGTASSRFSIVSNEVLSEVLLSNASGYYTLTDASGTIYINDRGN